MQWHSEFCAARVLVSRQSLSGKAVDWPEEKTRAPGSAINLAYGGHVFVECLGDVGLQAVFRRDGDDACLSADL